VTAPPIPIAVRLTLPSLLRGAPKEMWVQTEPFPDPDCVSYSLLPAMR